MEKQHQIKKEHFEGYETENILASSTKNGKRVRVVMRTRISDTIGGMVAYSYFIYQLNGEDIRRGSFDEVMSTYNQKH